MAAIAAIFTIILLIYFNSILAMQKKQILLFLSIFIIYAVLSVVFCSRFFSWQDLSGHAMTEGDPALNAWTLQWVSHALVSNPFDIFNGNAFYPNSHSIALAEHMFSLALINLPLRAISKNPWFGYNLLIFISYFFSCLGGFFLIKYLTNSIEAGFWGGIFWGFLFFRVHHIGHLQILAFQWIPFILLFLILFMKKPKARYIIIFAFFFLLQSLVSWYLAVITGFIVGIAFLILIKPSFFRLKTLQYFLSCASVCAAILLVFALPYFKTASNSSLKERIITSLLSGDNVVLRDYLIPPDSTLLGQLIENNSYWIWGENTLYIGFVPLLLSGYFIFKACKKPKQYFYKYNRIILLSITLIIIGFVFSKGYYSRQTNIHLPLFYITKIFSFLSAVRATQRFSIMIYLGVLILSGLGIEALLNHWRKPIGRYGVAIVLSTLFIVEVFPYKLPFDPKTPYRPSAADEYIANNLGEKASSVQLLHYPIFHFIDNYPTREAKYMVDSTIHWAKIVNGFSGEVPHGFMEDMKILQSLPDTAAIAWLKKFKVDLIAIHQETPDQQRKAILEYFGKNPKIRVVKLNSESEYLIDLENVLN